MYSFYLHLKESSENVFWIVIAPKSATFSSPESTFETAFETTCLMLFLKNFTKNLSCWSCLFWWNKSILQIFTFYSCYIFYYWGKLPSHAWLEKICIYEAPPLLFFPRNSSDYLYLLKIIISVAFFSNIFIKP